MGVSINCLKTVLTPCQPPVASHDWGGWQGVRTDAQAFLEIPDAINAILAAVGYNFRLLRRFLAQLLLRLIQMWLFGLAQRRQTIPAAPQD